MPRFMLARQHNQSPPKSALRETFEDHAFLLTFTPRLVLHSGHQGGDTNPLHRPRAIAGLLRYRGTPPFDLTRAFPGGRRDREEIHRHCAICSDASRQWRATAVSKRPRNVN